MLERSGTDQLATEQRPRRPRTASSRLHRCAVLALDGTVLPRKRHLPCELALQTLDGALNGSRPTRAWLVMAETMWPEAADRPDGDVVLPPVQVARELAEAVGGLRVYADDHLVVGRWLHDLFAAAGAGEVPFRVGDLIPFFLSLKATRDEVRKAEAEEVDCSVMTLRASSQAIRNATFARRLAALVDARKVRA